MGSRPYPWRIHVIYGYNNPHWCFFQYPIPKGLAIMNFAGVRGVLENPHIAGIE
jgi:hypothetical protein